MQFMSSQDEGRYILWIVTMGSFLEEMEFKLGLEVWRKLKITAIITSHCLNRKGDSWIWVCGFLFFASWYSIFLCEKIWPIWDNLFSIHFTFPPFHVCSLPLCPCSPGGICFCLASSVFLSGANDLVWLQFDLVSRPVVIENFQSSPWSDHTTFVHRQSHHQLLLTWHKK